MISLILPARNGGDLTQNCLRSVLHSLQALQLPAQLILIDDASAPSEQIRARFEAVRTQAPGHEVKIIRATERLHYSRVFAVGLHFAKHDNVLFISNDMLVTPHFLLALLGVAALDARFGIIRGTSNFVDSHPEHTVALPGELKSYGDVLSFSASRFNDLGLHHVEDRMLSGDAVLVKRRLIERIGVFDCRFFGYFGDIDYGMRAHLAGFKLVCAKGAWLHHLGGGYVKTEAMAGGKDYATLMAERLKVVDDAYQLFKAKWDPTLPPHVAEVTLTDYCALAERAAPRPALACAVPPSLIATLVVDERS